MLMQKGAPDGFYQQVEYMSVILSRLLRSIVFVATLPLVSALSEAAVGDGAVSGSPLVDSSGQNGDASGIGLDPNDVTVPEDEAKSHPEGKGPTGAGMGVGYPGYRGQGGDDAPHHRQYGAPPRAADE
jgi:hypothetical protein